MKKILYLITILFISNCTIIEKTKLSFQNNAKKEKGFVDSATFTRSVVGNTYDSGARCIHKEIEKYDFVICDAKLLSKVENECSNHIYRDKWKAHFQNEANKVCFANNQTI